jgi:hypothetical protein
MKCGIGAGRDKQIQILWRQLHALALLKTTGHAPVKVGGIRHPAFSASIMAGAASASAQSWWQRVYA